MNKISVIHRLYAGFAVLCLIIVCWGVFNSRIMSSFSDTTHELTSDYFPLSAQIQQVDSHRAEAGKQALSIMAAENPDTLAARLSALKTTITTLNTLASGISSLENIEKFPAVQAENTRVAHNVIALTSSVDQLGEYNRSVLEVSEIVNEGLSAFLANNAEMKRLLVREGTEPAGDDIYIRDLFTTIMENLANIELLIMQMVSTDDADKLASVIENLRVNTQTIEPDIDALVFEVP